jgi:Tfp pilus assembly protein PilN
MKAVNLIPGEQRQGAGNYAGRSGGGALILLGVIAGVVALIAMYGSAHRQISSQAGEVATLDAQTSAVEARTGKLAAYANFVTVANQRAETVSQLVASRFDWSHTLHELGRVLPSGTALSLLHGAVGSTEGSSAPAPTPGAAPTSSTPPGSTPLFTLSGCAESQSVVAQTLQRLRLMDGVSDVQLQSSTKSGAGAASSAGPNGGCPSGSATFSVQVVFAALPALSSSGAPGTGTGGASVQAVSAPSAGVSK